MLGLAGELREFEMPRPIFTNSEKITWAPGVYTSHHAELQIKTDLTKVIKGPGTKAQLEAARGQLTPFLRDALVGLNYAYYEPPGAQVLHNNSLFVRSHDFSGITVVATERYWQAPELMGVGTPAGGGAYLMGSLADLPYALAATEQDFIAPENVQALIWKELVPDLMVGATVPRWWSISPAELHAVTLYQRSGEELLTAASKNVPLRGQVMLILADRVSPQRLEVLEQSLVSGEDSIALLAQTMPADTFYLAAEGTGKDIQARRLRLAQRVSSLKRFARRVLRRIRLKAFRGIRSTSSGDGTELRSGNALRETIPLVWRRIEPALWRVMGVKQSLLGSSGQREGLRSGYAQSPCT